MLSDLTQEVGFDELADDIKQAAAITSDLIRRVIARACTRLPALTKSEKTARLERLIAAGAWNDAVLALIELELPAWSVRRLVRENDEWFCSLTRQPNLPVEFDDTVDASHKTLAMAILSAFIEARHRSRVLHAGVSIVPQIRPASESAICCDNFS